MPKLEEVYLRLQKNKKERADLNKMLQDELRGNEQYTELKEELKKLREQVKSIENEVKSNSQSEIDKLDELKTDIQSDMELLADIALNMYANQELVEIVDEYDQKWHPAFKVSFKKSN